MPSKSYLGYTLASRYRLVEELGHGSMGYVYGAKDQNLGVLVAVKFLSQSLMGDRMKERFKREARICAGLGAGLDASIHIVKVTDYGTGDKEDEGSPLHGYPFYVMEYLKGDSLNNIIRKNPIPVPRFLSFCRQICLGLQRAHQGIEIDGELHPIIHRDIKPSNVFIKADETLGELVKILDFGIAKTLADDSQQTKCFMGTLAYSSPEQMEGRDLDHRSDIYSLGVMLFQMLTGKMPLNADTRTFGGWYNAHREKAPRSFAAANPNVKVPKLLENLVMSCLEKDPANRPQTVSEIIQELEPLSQRFGRAVDFGNRIKNFLNDVPVQTPGEGLGQNLASRRPATPVLPGTIPPEPTVLHQPSPQVVAPPNRIPGAAMHPDDVCRLCSWPANMPQGDIVFSKVLPTSQQPLATLWVMLKREVINTLTHSLPYNKFLFAVAPHPVLLWLTVLYTHDLGPKWLPCYLDLKQLSGQKMVQVLAESKEYRVLFFAQEAPQQCVMVQTLNITEPSQKLIDLQAQQLQSFAQKGQQSPPSTRELSKISKDLLKNELKKLKPEVAQKLEAFV